MTVGIPLYQRPLGRREPGDDEHIRKYALRVLDQPTVQFVEKMLKLPTWHWTHDQGHEGSCVGHGAVMERAISNTVQNRVLRLLRPTRRYDPITIWNEAKRIDEWADTNPGDSHGTSVRAAYDVLRDRGARRVWRMRMDAKSIPCPVGLKDWNIQEGILTNRWATTVDEIRTAISQGNPVTIGVSWYDEFDRPEQDAHKEFWVARNGNLTAMRGGHCTTLYGASDGRQAFRMKNSWGRDYPLVWLPYKVMETLLREDGEAALVTDR